MATGTLEQVNQLFLNNGSTARFFRSESEVACPCLTPEGYRDPIWHIQHPTAVVCDPSGHLPDPAHTVNLSIKAFIQPVTSARGAKLPPELLVQVFGLEIQADDHIGMFPEAWSGVELDFYAWGRSAEDFIEYNERRYTVVNANLIPDVNGDPRHHWECGLRLIKSDD